MRFVFVSASPAFGRFVFALLIPSSNAMNVLRFYSSNIRHITPDHCFYSQIHMSENSATKTPWNRLDTRDYAGAFCRGEGGGGDETSSDRIGAEANALVISWFASRGTARAPNICLA